MKTQSTIMQAAWLLLSIPSALAHTWVEQLTVIAPNGTFVGEPGYSRGNMQRTQAGFEDVMVNLLPPNGRAQGNVLLPSDGICKSTQTIGNQTAGSPALIASPGDNIALRYQENGHVTLPNTQIGKQANRGTVYIYGTTQPSNDDKLLSIHKVWNAAGTGGDGRGRLLATRNFDDGQCYQLNGGNISTYRNNAFKHDTTDPLMGVNLWCQTDVQLPSNITSKSYSIYWVWDWPTMANVTGSGEPNGKIEIYTSCMDITMKAKSNTASKQAAHFVEGQQLDYAAIPEQLNNQFDVVVPGAPGAGSVTSTVAATGTMTAASATMTAAAATNANAAAKATPSPVTSAAANGATITVTQTQVFTQTQEATSLVTVTVTANANAVSPTPASAKSPVVTPFSQTTATTTMVSTSTLTSTSLVTVQSGTAQSTGTTHKLLLSRLRRHVQ